MTTNTSIAVTVLMPIYNSEKYLKEAIESILSQTFSNFELLIVNDGSSDSSDEIVRSFTDGRIKYIHNETNRGIVTALNEGLHLSRGKYIARMDADDIADPNRLALQYQFLKKNPDYKLCGTNAITINNAGQKIRQIRRPLHHPKIKTLQLFRNAFIHPAIMADASVMKALGYHKDYEYAEDYFLFSQIVMRYKSENLKFDGILYRIHNESISAKKLDAMVKGESKTMAYLLSFLFDEVSAEALAVHHHLLRPSEKLSTLEIEKIESHLLKIKKNNQTRGIFDVRCLEKQLQKEWYEVLRKSNVKNKLSRFASSKLFSFRIYNIKHLVKLFFA